VADYSFSRELRLLTPADFESVFNNSPQRAVSPQLTLLAISNSLKHPRVGFVIPKKKVRTAVERNRIKRIIRENIRHLQYKLPDIDIVAIAKNGIDKLPNEELHLLVKGLCKTVSRRCKESSKL
jgi:ribonuclease P protein component